jgi:hypothetical protein
VTVLTSNVHSEGHFIAAVIRSMKLCRIVNSRTITPYSLVGGTNVAEKLSSPLAGGKTVGLGPDLQESWFESRPSEDVRADGGAQSAYSMGTGVPSGRSSGRGAHLPTHLHPMQSVFLFFFFRARQHFAPIAPQPYAYCATLNTPLSTDSIFLHIPSRCEYNI